MKSVTRAMCGLAALAMFGVARAQTPDSGEARFRSLYKELVDLAMDALDLDKRAVLILHDLDGESVPDIARALGLPEGTVYSRLRAARAEFTAAVARVRRKGS